MTDDTLATLRRAESILLATTANATPGPWRAIRSPRSKALPLFGLDTEDEPITLSDAQMSKSNAIKAKLGANIIDAETGPLLGVIRDAIRLYEKGNKLYGAQGVIQTALTITTWIIDNTEGEGS